MFANFDGSASRTKRVALGGRSRAEESREQVLERTRLERERRRQQKLEAKSATTIQARRRQRAGRALASERGGAGPGGRAGRGRALVGQLASVAWQLLPRGHFPLLTSTAACCRRRGGPGTVRGATEQQ